MWLLAKHSQIPHYPWNRWICILHYFSIFYYFPFYFSINFHYFYFPPFVICSQPSFFQIFTFHCPSTSKLLHYFDSYTNTHNSSGNICSIPGRSSTVKGMKRSQIKCLRQILHLPSCFICRNRWWSRKICRLFKWCLNAMKIRCVRMKSPRAGTCRSQQLFATQQSYWFNS